MCMNRSNSGRGLEKSKGSVCVFAGGRGSEETGGEGETMLFYPCYFSQGRPFWKGDIRAETWRKQGGAILGEILSIPQWSFPNISSLKALLTNPVRNVLASLSLFLQTALHHNYLLPFSLKVKSLWLVIIYYLFLATINAQLIFKMYLLGQKNSQVVLGEQEARGGVRKEYWFFIRHKKL